MEEVIKGFDITIEESEEARNDISDQLDTLYRKKERVGARADSIK